MLSVQTNKPLEFEPPGAFERSLAGILATLAVICKEPTPSPHSPPRKNCDTGESGHL